MGMEIDVESRRGVALLTLGVVVAIVVASIGFQSLSTNPLVPDASFEVQDTGDEYDPSRPGTVAAVTIEHTDGTAINTSTVEVILGSTTGGLRFNQTGNWTVETSQATFGVLLNDRRPDEAATFGPEDRLVVAKTEGTFAFNGTADIRVRLYHVPSQRALVDEQVELG
jgi:frataxin-like iron-binding protein CyaY